MTYRAAAAVALALGTAACAHAGSARTTTPTQRPVDATSTSVTALASGATPSGESCPADHGALSYRTIPVDGGVSHLGIYLPPCDPGGTRHRYPTVYLLHGGGTDETQWEAIGLARTADRLIVGRQISPIIVVMPRSGLDPGDTSMVDAVIPWVDANLPTSASKADRAIGGISRGGGAALGLVALHPALFSRVGGHSPLVQSSSTLLDQIATWGGAVWLDVGQADGLRRATESFAGDLEARGAHPQLNVWPGGHDRPYWGAHLADDLRFYAAAWPDPRR